MQQRPPADIGTDTEWLLRKHNGETKRHKKVVGGVRRAIEENMAERLLWKIGDNTIIQEEGLSEEVQCVRPDLNFVIRTFGSNHTVLIDISRPFQRISYGANTLEKIYIDIKKEYSKLAEETSNFRDVHLEIISIMFSSLGTVYTRAFEALRNLLFCDDKKMKRIERRLSQAAFMRSIEIWRRCAKGMPRAEHTRAA
jgi:hypothetical protein